MALLAETVATGGYVSIVKLILYILLAFGWLPLTAWVNQDARAVRTPAATKWVVMVFAAGAAGSIVWLLLPLYWIGMLVHIIAVSATNMAYVMHRNSRVSEYEKVLTAEHIKSLFANEKKTVAKASKGFVFITANGNEVPAPQSKTPEFIGYQAVQQIIDDAMWRRASTVNFTPHGEQYLVHYVIDGISTRQEDRDRESMEHTTRYLKHLADLDVNEKRKPQRGIFAVRKDNNKTEWELTTSGSTAGEQLRLRAVREYDLIKLEDLGLFAEQLEQIAQLKEKKGGLFIVAGPKKSGTTSTFYALVRNHDPFMNNINTIEKHPAAELQNITQNRYSLTDTGTTTYARRLQSVLRTGPDIVGIGECEDAETAKLACLSAKEGRTTYMVIESPSTLQALATVIKYVGDKNLVFDVLTGISCQRLVRKLCENCRDAYQPNPDILRKFNIPAGKVKVFYRPGEVTYDKKGNPIPCEHCQGTGFFGRTGVFETILFTQELREAAKKAKDLNEISNLFRRAKMLYLQEQAIRKVADGTTSINEIIREFSTQDAKKRPPTAETQKQS